MFALTEYITHQNVNFDKNEAFEIGFGCRLIFSPLRFILGAGCFYLHQFADTEVIEFLI